MTHHEWEADMNDEKFQTFYKENKSTASPMSLISQHYKNMGYDGISIKIGSGFDQAVIYHPEKLQILKEEIMNNYKQKDSAIAAYKQIIAEASNDEEYSERHAAMINSIAKHTTHKSVVDRINARTNTDLSFAKNAIKTNSLYTHSPIMEAYLRFLK
jgi:hypothetical protein